MSLAVLGIDLGKNSCSVVGLDESGAVVKRRRMHRDSIVVFAKAFLHVSSPWKRVAGRTIWAGR